MFDASCVSMERGWWGHVLCGAADEDAVDLQRVPVLPRPIRLHTHHTGRRADRCQREGGGRAHNRISFREVVPCVLICEAYHGKDEEDEAEAGKDEDAPPHRPRLPLDDPHTQLDGGHIIPRGGGVACLLAAWIGRPGLLGTQSKRGGRLSSVKKQWRRHEPIPVLPTIGPPLSVT